MIDINAFLGVIVFGGMPLAVRKLWRPAIDGDLYSAFFVFLLSAAFVGGLYGALASSSSLIHLRTAHTRGSVISFAGKART